MIRGVFRREGLSLKTLPVEQFSNHSVMTTIVGYSSSLPIVDEIYMKDGDGLDSMVFFSPFLNLSMGHFTHEELQRFDAFVTRLQNRVLPHKEAFQELLPIVRKGNIPAYCKKFAKLYGEKVVLDSMIKVYENYMKLVKGLYYDMKSLHYSQNECKQYVDPIFEFIQHTKAKELKMALNGTGPMNEWFRDRALPYIAKVANIVEKLIPCMIFSVVGEYGIFNRGKLYLTTIAHDDAANLYKEGYEVFVKGLPYLVGIRNMMANGCVNQFSNAGMKGVDSLVAFAGLPGGLMEDKLADDNHVMGWIGNAMNHKVRNAASHDGLVYDPLSQTVECHYCPQKWDEMYRLPLIELCDMVYMQWLHIMEQALMAFMIQTRSNSED